MLFEYDHVKINRVIDGDTLDITIDMGFSTYKNTHLRLSGINTPEVRGAREKKAGKVVKDAVINLFDHLRQLDAQYKVIVVGRPVYYGRCIGSLQIAIDGEQFVDYANALRNIRAAESMDKKREPFPKKLMQSLIKRGNLAVSADLIIEIGGYVP